MWLFYFVLIHLLDIVSTVIGWDMKAEEINPVVGRLVESYGFLGLCVYKAIFVFLLVVVCLIVRSRSSFVYKGTVSTNNVLYTLIVLNNFLVYFGVF